MEQAIAGPRQLRKKKELDPLRSGALDPLEVLGEIGIDIAEARVDLGKSDSQLGGHGRCSR